MSGNTVCALISAGFIFRGFAIFMVFVFLNSWLMDTGVSAYAIIVYGSCRGAKLLDSLDSFEDVVYIISNGELHQRISQGGMGAFH